MIATRAVGANIVTVARRADTIPLAPRAERLLLILVFLLMLGVRELLDDGEGGGCCGSRRLCSNNQVPALAAAEPNTSVAKWYVGSIYSVGAKLDHVTRLNTM